MNISVPNPSVFHSEPPSPQGRTWDGNGLVYEVRSNLTKSARRGLGGSPGRERFDQPSRSRRAPVIHVRRQVAPSWFTPSGVRAKLQQLAHKGLPDMTGWRFITLSVDPKQFGDDPLTAWLELSPKVRRFIEAGRKKGLWDRGHKWARKLEFQANGWPHWHIPLERFSKVSEAELGKIRKLWKFGRTNVRRITRHSQGYSFKYVFKGVYQDGEERHYCVPKWFRDYCSTRKVSVKWKDADGVEHVQRNVDKPDMSGGIRFWQTSPNFYESKPVPSVVKQANTCRLPRTAGEVMEDNAKRLIVCARDISGNYVKASSLTLDCEPEDFTRLHLWDVENRAGRVLSSRSFVVALDTLNRTTKQIDQWKLQQLAKENRLTLRVADNLRRQGKDLMNC